MPSLKDLRNRISSVKSTKKITSAMKMVAAAKLKRAQDNAEKTRPYALKMSEIVNSLVQNNVSKEFKFSYKKNKTKTVLLIICSADRGLCGGFNGSIIKFSKKLSETKTSEGLKLNYIFVGKKAYNSLKKFCGDSVIDFFTDIANPSIKFELASSIRDKILELFLQNSIDECHLIYTKFKSAISQTVKSTRLLPLIASTQEQTKDDQINKSYYFIRTRVLYINLAIRINFKYLCSCNHKFMIVPTSNIISKRGRAF